MCLFGKQVYRHEHEETDSGETADHDQRGQCANPPRDADLCGEASTDDGATARKDVGEMEELTKFDRALLNAAQGDVVHHLCAENDRLRAENEYWVTCCNHLAVQLDVERRCSNGYRAMRATAITFAIVTAVLAWKVFRL